MKEFFKHNRGAAFCALAVIIVLSVFLGTLRSVNGLEKKVGKFYSDSTSKYVSVSSDLGKLRSYATDLFAVADAHGCADKDFSDALRNLSDVISSPFGQENAVKDLVTAANTAYRHLAAADGVSDAEMTTAKLNFYDIDASFKRLINNSDYNKAAQKYNSAVNSFPASIIVVGKSDAAVFN